LHKFRQKTLTACYKVSLSRNFQQQSCSAINHLWNGINTFVGDDPIAVKFGPKGTNAQQERCTFHVTHAERCAVGVSRPSCKIYSL